MFELRAWALSSVKRIGESVEPYSMPIFVSQAPEINKF